MIPQPLNQEYVTIKRGEYDELVDIAKRVAVLKSHGRADIDVLHLRLERARRIRRGRFA